MPITKEDIKHFEAEQKETLEEFCMHLRVALMEKEHPIFPTKGKDLEEIIASSLRYAYLKRSYVTRGMSEIFTEVQEQLFPGNPTPWIKEEDQKEEESEGERTETQG